MDADGYVCLTDFGLATVCKAGRQTISQCGTVEYMAPQVVEGTPYDFKADWWSLGILTYELCTGFTPFIDRDHNEEKMFHSILNYDPCKPDTKHFGYEVSEDCWSFISALL